MGALNVGEPFEKELSSCSELKVGVKGGNKQYKGKSSEALNNMNEGK